MARKRRIIGLMSGTSVDGIDAALVEVSGDGSRSEVRLLGFGFTPFPEDLRQEILGLSDPATGSVDRVCRMHAVLGEWFAKAALDVCEEAGIPLSEVDAVGSHGQTVHHLPEPYEAFGVSVRSTLQIGDPSVIAERTGLTTVADFRARDVAAGGQGAPLVPLVDFLLFRSQRVGRVMLNIGGIANVTVLPRGCESSDVFAFDTGPGNMPIDGLVAALTDGERRFDVDGSMARRGTVCEPLLEELMAHPFLVEAPPKSTGRESFGRSLVDRVLRDWRGLPGPDLVRTATAFTAGSIADAVCRFVKPQCEVREVAVSGGGADNPVLMDILGNALDEVDLLRVDTLGVPSDAKEAVAFGVLAYETLEGRAGNLPHVSGASRSVVLGAVIPGRAGMNKG
ncbi:MAG: anhydro-N-acetylmuramic acid kinase [Candidatus Latescibacteria bacterium]|nr:anhydro-N-acetylmuramic acid kinase [Candidatus Latescibacterota bacterium]